MRMLCEESTKHEGADMDDSEGKGDSAK